MVRAYISVGSNIDRERNVAAALDALSAALGELHLSSVFESASVGFEGDAFYNLVVGVDTAVTVGELAETLRGIEDAFGRLRGVPRFSSRPLDLDLLTYGDVVGAVQGVLLPRKQVTEDPFVLAPLAEIAGDDIHPATEHSYTDLWRHFEGDKGAVRPVDFVWGGRPISRARG